MFAFVGILKEKGNPNKVQSCLIYLRYKKVSFSFLGSIMARCFSKQQFCPGLDSMIAMPPDVSKLSISKIKQSVRHFVPPQSNVTRASNVVKISRQTLCIVNCFSNAFVSLT